MAIGLEGLVLRAQADAPDVDELNRPRCGRVGGEIRRCRERHEACGRLRCLLGARLPELSLHPVNHTAEVVTQNENAADGGQ